MYDSSNQGLRWKRSFCGRKFIRHILVLIDASETWQCTFRKSVFCFDFARFSIFSFTATSSSIPSRKTSLANLAVTGEWSTGIERLSRRTRILVVRKFQKNLFNFNFFWQSHSLFSKTTGFVSSIKASIENFPDLEIFDNCPSVFFESGSSHFEHFEKCFSFARFSG